MKTSLISLPMADVCMPQLGISSIKGYLHKNGIDNVRCYDLSLDFFYYCTDEEILKKCVEEAKGALLTGSNASNSKKNIFLLECYINGDYICQNIKNSISKMKEPTTYRCYNEYKKHTSVIERALKLFSVKFYPTLITPSFISFQKGEEQQDIIENYINDVSQNPLISFYKSKLPYIIQSDTEYVGISINYSAQIIPGLTLAKMIKQDYTNVKIIFGGSLFPAYSQRRRDLDIFAKYSDALIVFAGEYPWCQILKHNRLEEIPGCMYSVNGIYIDNNLPIPDIERTCPVFLDFKLNDYITPEMILPYTMSIGCYWGKCQFCGYQYYKDPYISKRREDILGKIILDDLQCLNSVYNATNFYFVDEAMPANIGKEIANGIISNCYKFSWYSEFRFDSFMNYGYLEHLKAGGCSLLFFGLESGNDRVLNRMQKGTTRARITQILNDCKKLDLKTMPMLFFGFPSETEAEAMDTIELLKSLNGAIQHLGVGYFVLLRDTPTYYNADKFGIHIIKRKGELCLSDNYSVENGMSHSMAQKMVEDVYKDEILFKYFDYVLLSRSHLLFLPNAQETICIKKIFEYDKKYVLCKNCKIMHIFYDLHTGETLELTKNYLVDFEKNCYYELSNEDANSLERCSIYIREVIEKDIRLFKLVCYFVRENLIIEQEQ